MNLRKVTCLISEIQCEAHLFLCMHLIGFLVKISVLNSLSDSALRMVHVIEFHTRYYLL